MRCNNNANSYFTVILIQNSKVDLDPSASNLSFSSSFNNDCFVIKYNSRGLLWVNDTTSLPTGQKEQFQSKLNIFPIPSTDLTNIQSTSNAQFTYLIYNSCGSMVSSEICYTQVDVSNLPVGTYLIVLADNQNNKITTSDFLKK